MARVTVEDCIVHIPNRFELVLMASTRAKQITSGNPLTIDRDNDKDGVVALREIADQTVSISQLEEGLIQSYFKRPVSDIADKKLLTSGEDIPSDVEEAFKDAAAHISSPQAVVEAEGDDGMAFGEENIEAED